MSAEVESSKRSGEWLMKTAADLIEAAAIGVANGVEPPGQLQAFDADPESAADESFELRSDAISTDEAIRRIADRGVEGFSGIAGFTTFNASTMRLTAYAIDFETGKALKAGMAMKKTMLGKFKLVGESMDFEGFANDLRVACGFPEAD